MSENDRERWHGSKPGSSGTGIGDVWRPQGHTAPAVSVPDPRRGLTACRHCSASVRVVQRESGAWVTLEADSDATHRCEQKSRVRKCRRCGLPITFRQNAVGGWVACDVSGGRHVCRRRR